MGTNERIAALEEKIAELEKLLKAATTNLSSTSTTLSTHGGSGDLKNVSLADIPLFSDYTTEVQGELVVDWESFKRLFKSTLTLALRGQPARDHALIGYTALQKAGKTMATFKNILKAFVPDPENPPAVNDLLTELEGFYLSSSVARESSAKDKFDSFEFDMSKNLKALRLAYLDMLREVQFEGYVPSASDELKKLVKLMKGTELQQRILDHLDSSNLTAKGIMARLESCAKTDELTGGTSNGATTYLASTRKKKRPDNANFGTPQKPSSPSPSTPSPAKKPSDGSKKTCYRCGRDDHLQSDCFYKDKTCNKCGTKGHKGSVCQKSKKKENKAQANVSVEPQDKTVVQYAVMSSSRVVEQAGKRRVLVDSGNTAVHQLLK